MGKSIRKSDRAEFGVSYVGKFDGYIGHEVVYPDGNVSMRLKAGDNIKGIIDWDRLYMHMRMHTATHVIANVIEKGAGAQIKPETNLVLIKAGRISALKLLIEINSLSTRRLPMS